MGVELRPKFELALELGAERLLERLDRRLRTPGCSLCGVVTPTRIELQVPLSRKRLWSPELRVEVERAGGGCHLTGTYGPHLHVWTLFVGIYAGLSFFAFLALIFALAQWTLAESPRALFVLPLLVLLALAARSLAFVGQGLAQQQIDELRAFLDQTIADAADQVPRRSGVRALKPTHAERDDSSEAV
jgi:hypothetical protein